MKNKPIGVYDSGIGGITILNILQKKFPNEDFIYFADTANLPYGNKSNEQIIQYSNNIISWFEDRGVKAIVAACHTSSAIAIDLLNLNIPLIGTIYPMVKGIIEETNYQNIAIIATQASVESKIHEKVFLKYGFKGTVISIACPDFVPHIENNTIYSKELFESAKKYLAILKNNKIDVLIYGCTHYPFIEPIIKNIIPGSIKLIDPAIYIAKEVGNLINKKFLFNDKNNKGNVEFYCSGNSEEFFNKIEKITTLNKINFKLI